MRTTTGVDVPIPRGRLAWVLLFVALLAPAALAPIAQADPYGQTVARIDLERHPGEQHGELHGELQVALRLDPSQLGQALGSYFGKPFGWQDEDAEARILRYLEDTFAIELPPPPPSNEIGDGADEGPERLAIEWVGREWISHREAWLYFRLPVPARQLERGLDGLVVHQRIFFEIQPRQANTIRLRDGDRQISYLLTRENPSQRIAPEP